jgi:hypothetical protein
MIVSSIPKICLAWYLKGTQELFQPRTATIVVFLILKSELSPALLICFCKQSKKSVEIQDLFLIPFLDSLKYNVKGCHNQSLNMCKLNYLNWKYKPLLDARPTPGHRSKSEQPTLAPNDKLCLKIPTYTRITDTMIFNP